MKTDKLRSILIDYERFQTINSALCLKPKECAPKETAGRGILGNVKDFLKKHNNLYYLIINYLSPVRSSAHYRSVAVDLLNKYDGTAVILNLGSGPDVFMNRKDIINIDMFAFNGVSLCADLRDVPVKDSSADVCICIATLEHMVDPESCLAEIKRILKPGGLILCSVPFIQPFHAAPQDFWRWTIEGLRVIFHDFTILESGLSAGPTSGALWIFIDWLALLFSFGNKVLHDVCTIILMPIISQLKYLDIVLERYPLGKNIGSSAFVLARK